MADKCAKRNRGVGLITDWKIDGYVIEIERTRKNDLRMRRILEKVFPTIGHDIFLGVDRQLLVRIHRYQHLTDVGLQIDRDKFSLGFSR